MINFREFQNIANSDLTAKENHNSGLGRIQTSEETHKFPGQQTSLFHRAKFYRSLSSKSSWSRVLCAVFSAKSR